MPTLDWLNRASAFNTAARASYRLLEQVSVHTPTAAASAPAPSPLWGEGGGEGLHPNANPNSNFSHDNLLIQGDNLEALKALPPFYRGQVKCIGHNDEAKKEMRSLFNQNLFGTPKPERLLQRIPISLHTKTTSSSTPSSAQAPPPLSRTKWAAAGSASTWASRAASARRWPGGLGETASRFAVAAFASCGWARRCLTRPAASTQPCASPPSPPSSGSRKPARLLTL